MFNLTSKEIINCVHTLFFSNGSLTFWLYPKNSTKVCIVNELYLKMKIVLFNYCMARKPVKHMKELGDYENFYDMPEKQGNYPYKFLVKIKSKPETKENSKLPNKTPDYHVDTAH